MEYSSQMAPQRLQNESVSESGRGPAFKVLLSPASSTPPPPLPLECMMLVLTLCWIIIYKKKLWMHRSLRKHIGKLTVKNNLKRQEVWGEWHIREAVTLAYLISRPSWKTRCWELGRGTAALPGAPSDGLAGLETGGIKATLIDFFPSPPLQGKGSGEAWK